MSHKNRPHNAQETTVIIRLELPEHLYEAYARQAAPLDKQPEELMEQRLNRCKDISGSGIYFDEAQKKRLGHVIGKMVGDAEGVLQRLETISTLKVAGLEVELEPRLLQRLKTRVFRGESYEKVIQREVLGGLRRFCGIDPS